MEGRLLALLGAFSPAIAAKKLIGRGVSLLLAYLSARGAAKYGVSIDPDLLTAALFLKLELLLDYLKQLNGSDEGFDRRIAAESLYRQNAATLSNMLRRVGGGDRRRTDAINAALDAMATELGIQL